MPVTRELRRSGGQPRAELRPQPGVGVGADDHADMTFFEHNTLLVQTSNEIIENGHRRPGRDVIVAGGDGQCGRGDGARIDFLPADEPFALEQQILLVEVFDIGAENLTGKGNRIIEPDLHGGEPAHKRFIMLAIPVLERLDQFVGGADHVKGGVE